MRIAGVRQLGVVGLLVAGIAAPAAAQDKDREWREFGERIGRAAAAIAESVVAEVAAAMEAEVEQQRARQQRAPQPRAQRAQRDADVLTEEFSQSYSVGRNGRLRVETLVGNITIERGSGETIQVRALKRVRNTSEAQARRMLPGIEINVAHRGSTVDVRTENRVRGGNWQGQVDYTITVPPMTQLFLESRSGNIRIAGVEGDIRAASFSGNVSATDIKRARELKSLSGNVTIADADGEEFSGESHSGNVTIRNVKAGIVGLKTTSGEVRVADVQASRAMLESLSGNIEYQGRLARGGRYEMRTHSGNIRVVPGDDTVPLQLEAYTLSGDVTSDLQVMLNSFGSRRNFNVPIQQAEAPPSGNSAVLSLRTTSGNIRIVKR